MPSGSLRIGLRALVMLVAGCAVAFAAYLAIGERLRPIDRAVRFLRNGSVPQRREAARALAENGDPASARTVETALLGALNDADPMVRATAARGLAANGRSTSLLIPTLRGLLDDPSAEVRVRAVHATGLLKTDGEPLWPRLVLRTTDSDPQVRAGAMTAAALIQPDPERLRPILLAGLTDTDRETRRAALEKADAWDPEPFLGLLDDPDDSLATAAFRGVMRKMSERLARRTPSPLDPSILERLAALSGRDGFEAARTAREESLALNTTLIRVGRELDFRTLLRQEWRRRAVEMGREEIPVILGAAEAAFPALALLDAARRRGDRLPPGLMDLVSEIYESHRRSAAKIEANLARHVWAAAASSEPGRRKLAAEALDLLPVGSVLDRVDLLLPLLDDGPETRDHAANKILMTVSGLRGRPDRAATSKAVFEAVASRIESERNPEVLRSYFRILAAYPDQAARGVPPIVARVETDGMELHALGALTPYTIGFMTKRAFQEELRPLPARLKRLILSGDSRIRLAAALHIHRLAAMTPEGRDARQAALRHPDDQDVRLIASSGKVDRRLGSPEPSGRVVGPEGLQTTAPRPIPGGDAAKPSARSAREP